ncbi:hypothetical protein CCM_06797 [Cordyceps militaris CM01]|uniref:Uncharacterized protein n=1 Tax=Cordyceps militaris (strain CM01) TaxID=983644 RepID=G3JL03_CORMM|nr:uncharacterized protein CCM_06797 [Cordyceps militaris CM01]EGX90377.1 hypothetical protein CCM_06797 [Cordyceps militaris CM01]
MCTSNCNTMELNGPDNKPDTSPMPKDRHRKQRSNPDRKPITHQMPVNQKSRPSPLVAGNTK